MLGYVIQNKDTGSYVAWPGSAKSCTKDILSARRFPTREAAEGDCCGNERVVGLDSRLDRDRRFPNYGDQHAPRDQIRDL